MKHPYAIADWERIDWERYTNKEISINFDCCYATVCYNRKRYASSTVKKRKRWKTKINDMVLGKQKFIVANDFKEQAAVRNAAYNMGYKVNAKVVNGKWHMYLGDKQ